MVTVSRWIERMCRGAFRTSNWLSDFISIRFLEWWLFIGWEKKLENIIWNRLWGILVLENKAHRKKRSVESITTRIFIKCLSVSKIENSQGSLLLFHLEILEATDRILTRFVENAISNWNYFCSKEISGVNRFMYRISSGSFRDFLKHEMAKSTVIELWKHLGMNKKSAYVFVPREKTISTLR